MTSILKKSLKNEKRKRKKEKKKWNENEPKFKVGDHVKILKYKSFLWKVAFQVSLKKFLWLKKLKILCHEYILLVILKVVGTF